MALEPGLNGNTIRSLTMQNFTTFADATLNFKNLNIVIGENGLGKTHLLKLLYVVMAANRRPYGRSANEPTEHGQSDKRVAGNERPTKNILAKRLTGKLTKVFGPEKRVGRLVRRKQGQSRCKVNVEVGNDGVLTIFDFTTSSSKVSVTNHPQSWYDDAPVFLPTHELMTIYQGFAWIYETYDTAFDETWYDTIKLLGAPPLRGRRKKYASKLSEPLELVLGGTIMFDGSKFYLQQDGKMEMPLVAEGLRKVGMLAQLINTGQLLDKGCLFWDEPESNLNPKIIRKIAEAIFHIAQSGIQVFIATHSVFLLKELAILGHGQEVCEQRYFALEKGEDGVVVHQTDDIYDIRPFTMLDEEGEQSYRFIEKLQK